MSESGRGTSAIRPNQPARQVIATFDDYADAESAVDLRSDQHFAVDESAIDGHETSGGRRDVTSTQPSQPRHYEVLADVEVADEPCACSPAGPIERNEPWRPL
ncbi:hypothetical protein [Nocardia nova]|uniref:hypothetical protein n=1 Tax=Nocardia nova TaxID=37330 RepID=UPI001FE4E241